MDELLRSNDPVLISFVEALLNEAGIPHHAVDQHMSVVEGSLGILPKRLLIPADRIVAARAVLVEAGLSAELAPARR